jgi:hypothetical protein
LGLLKLSNNNKRQDGRARTRASGNGERQSKIQEALKLTDT